MAASGHKSLGQVTGICPKASVIPGASLTVVNICFTVEDHLAKWFHRKTEAERRKHYGRRIMLNRGANLFDHARVVKVQP